MQYLLLLSKENLDMSIEEVLSLLNPKFYEVVDNLLWIELEKKDIRFLKKRLALTKKIFRILFITDNEKIKQGIDSFHWQKIFRQDFSVRIEHGFQPNNKDFTEKNLAAPIWRKVKNPKVNLENPKTPIYFLFTNKEIFCCLLEKEIDHDFDPRKPHNRPEHHPSSLSPRLARALINLTGIKKGLLIDAFCGSGGILIEAGLMGLKPVGYDIDQIMLNRAEINLKHYGIKKYRLGKKDALKADKRIKYLISDLPYGKNTRQKEISKLYENFLKKLGHILIKRAVIIFPSFPKNNMDYEKLIKQSKLKIINSFEHYLHKSLSKKIFVLENK